MGIEVFEKHIREKRAIKIDAGMENTNLDSIRKICRSAQKAHVSAIDIACDRKVYNVARQNTKLPLFHTTPYPYEILNSAKMGFDGVQIGGFELLLKNGKEYKYTQIRDIILQSLALVENYDIYTCVTIPSFLNPEEKLFLLQDLNIYGVDLIQSDAYEMNIQNRQKYLTYNSDLAIDTAMKYVKNTSLPVMCPVLLTDDSFSNIFNNGIQAVNINPCYEKYSTEAMLSVELAKVVGMVSYRNSINREIVKTKREMQF